MGYLIVFIVSMVPLIELRGAIPYATAMGLNIPLSFVIAVIGNIIPVPLIYFFARKVLDWGKDKKFIGKFCQFCLTRGEKAGNKLSQKAGGSVYAALLLFVGIPIPGTGAWTGTLGASLLNLDFKKSVISIILGVCLAGVIMYLGTAGILTIFR